MYKKLLFLTCFFLVQGMITLVIADVIVPAMFSDHAILQRDISVPVWGTASPGETVTVDFGGQSQVTTTNVNGDWLVILDPMEASTSPGDMVITGNSSNLITITDVQVGEVWFGGGQSNMQRPLSDDCDAAAAIADAGNYNMRFFNVTANGGNVSNTVWQVSDAGAASDMSAVHYYFGRHLAQEMPDMPIGLITSAVSATAIERWATCAGSGGLYTSRVAPLQPYAIRGATWYQGEWDARGANDASKYYWQLPCLIDEWRTDWEQGSFPFYIVQMPKMGINSIHIVRDAELQTALDDPMVEMIVTIDQPGHDVHPPCKDPFGVRMAELALEAEYGHNIQAQSPFHSAAASYVTGDKIGVVFENVGSGLQSSGGALAEWEITDSSGSYVAAAAEIVSSDTVEVSSDAVPDPVSARYAFSTNPDSNNLVNSNDLPASPIKEVTPATGVDVCPDGFCSANENPCNCAADCGAPPYNETDCADSFDEDCDGDTDCDDPDCLDDPACPYCGDGLCDPGEDPCNCSNDCETPQVSETDCTDEIDEDCDGYVDCNDSDCGSNPICMECKGFKETCYSNKDCCSGKCRGGACR